MLPDNSREFEKLLTERALCQLAGEDVALSDNVTEFPVNPKLVAAVPPWVPLQSPSAVLIQPCAISRKGIIRA